MTPFCPSAPRPASRTSWRRRSESDAAASSSRRLFDPNAVRWALWAFAVLCLLFGSVMGRSAHAAAPDEGAAKVSEVRRFVLVVGANDGGSERVELRYAVDDANAVASVLTEIGGLRPQDRHVLEDPTTDELLWVIGDIAAKVKRAHKSGANVQFLFYYSGHSDEKGLLLGEQRMEYRELRKAIDVVGSDVRLAILDSCASGAFTRLKGGRKRAPFLVGSAADVKGHAFLTSSSADEVAQESDRVGGSFFTHYFTTGLRGAADADGDKLVTLNEAYEFAFDETLAQTEASRGGAQHAAYDINLTGSGDLILTDLRRTTARLQLGSDIGGRVFVRRSGGELAAELYKPAGGGAVLLALEPGRYQVTVDDGTMLLRAETLVRAKEVAELDTAAFREIPREVTRERGSGRGTGRDAYETIDANVGLFPPLSINGQSKAWAEGRRIRNKFSFGVIWTEADFIDGAALALGGTVARQRVEGLQLSLFGNVVRGHIRGAQIAQGFNSARSVRGGQSAFVNHAGTVHGAQVGTVNLVGDLTGAQVGLLNVGGKVGGAQVGLFSFAESATAQVALFSATREFGVRPEVWTSDTALLNIGLRFPARRTYTEMVLGLHPLGSSNEAWVFGVVFGVHTPLGNKLFIDVDIATLGVANGLGFQQPLGSLSKLRLSVGWQPLKHVAIFGGPTFNALSDRVEGETRDTVRPGYGWAYTAKHGSDRLRLWPGFFAGIRF